MPTNNKKSNQIGEVTVYSKKKYVDELKKQQEKYLADMSKYKQDSAQWVKANELYQDSLKLYSDILEGATKTAITSAKGYQKNKVKDLIDNVVSGKNIRFWEEAKAEKPNRDINDAKWYDSQIEKAKKNQKYYSNPSNVKKVATQSYNSDIFNFETGSGYQLKYGKEKYKEYEYPDTGYMFTPIVPSKERPISTYIPYLKGFIKYRENEIANTIKANTNRVSVSGMAATTIEGAKSEIEEAKKILNQISSNIKPIGYTMGLESLSRPIYKKPVVKPITPLRPEFKPSIKYDPKYENLQMRSLWANKAKADTTSKVGVLNPLDYNNDSKGFTIGEASKFPQEIKDKYNIDMIGKRVGIKRNGGTIKYSKPPKHMLGAILGVTNTALGIYNTIKANKEAKDAEKLARNQRNSMLLEEDRMVMDEYPTTGNENISGFYKGGGNLANPTFKTKGGNLIPMASNMNLVKGNTHGQDTIDNTNGVKLINATGQAVAEVEDDEVIKDNKKVYSDKLTVKVKGKNVTYAQEAERISKKVGEAEKILSDPNINFRKKNAAKIQRDNWTKAADDLFYHQEQIKREQGIDNDSIPIPKGQIGMNIFNNQANQNAFNYMKNNPKQSNFSKVAPYLDNVANAVMTAFTPKPAFPLLARQRKLKTDFNINPQLQEVTDTVNQTAQGIERGTSSSNVARQNTTAVRLAGMKEKGRLYGQKENIETQLHNQDIGNKQQIEGQNLARIQGFQDSMQQRAYNIQGRTSANVANAIEDFNQQEHATAYGKYQDEQLNVIKKTYNAGGSELRVDLNNPAQIEYLRNNPTSKENAAKDYLQKNSDGTYKYPREAQRFKQVFPEYN